MEKQKLRSEIDDKYKWDLSLIYKSDIDWKKDLELAKEKIKKIADFKDLLSSSKRLLAYIKYDQEIERLIYKLFYYAHLNFDSDTTNTKYQQMMTNIRDLMKDYSEYYSLLKQMYYL